MCSPRADGPDAVLGVLDVLGVLPANGHRGPLRTDTPEAPPSGIGSSVLAAPDRHGPGAPRPRPSRPSRPSRTPSQRHPPASRNVKPRMPLTPLSVTPARPKAFDEAAEPVDGATTPCWCCLPGLPHSAPPAAAHRHDADPERHREEAAEAHPDSFAGAMRHALVVGYCFSMLQPEAGPDRPAARRWSLARLLRALYAGAVVAGLSVQAALSLYREMTADSLWDTSVDMMFFGSATAASLLFLELGPRWRRLTRSFTRVEALMADFGYPARMRGSMVRLTALVMLGAAVEHVLSVWSAVDFTWPCFEEAGLAGLFKGYSLLKFPMTFDVIAYEHWRAMVVLFLNFVATFFWNFNHLFVILLSIPLAQRFKQVNDRLEAVVGKVMADTFWRRTRETYNELSVLSRQVDSVAGKLVLLSFATNMYFICRQLLHSFRTLRTGFWYNLYFSYSFGFMLLRTVLVSLFAASVHDQSRKPLPVLFAVPAEGFTPEVERFMCQVTRDHVALTGCRFFSVTRGLLLTVAGTIISYEIVLMQLNPVTAVTAQKTDHMDHCRL